MVRLFVMLIDIRRGKQSSGLLSIGHKLNSLMIRVNMAHWLGLYKEAMRGKSTIAKIHPIRGKNNNNNKKQHLTAQNALHPREQPQLLLHVRRRELWEK